MIRVKLDCVKLQDAGCKGQGAKKNPAYGIPIRDCAEDQT